MMGIGTNNVIKVDFSVMTPRELVDLIQRNNIFMIISSFEVAEDGTVDTIDKFSKVNIGRNRESYNANVSW